MAFHILLQLVAPRPLLVIAVMVTTLSVIMRNFTIEAANLKGVNRRRSNVYGNFMGVATATFSFPAAIQLAAASSGSI